MTRDSNANATRRTVVVAAVLFVLGAAVGGGTGFALDWFGSGKSDSQPTPAPTPQPQQASPAARVAAPALPSFADMAAAAKPAVVNISTTQTMKGGGDAEGMFGPGGPFSGPPGGGGGQSPFGGPGSPFDEFFRRFLPPMPKNFKRRSLGSGFLIDSQGTIVTNSHVVEHADEIIVRLSGDGHEYKAKVLGADSKTDLAVIRIEPKGGELAFLHVGDSSKMRVGDWVVAIGNPFGLEQTVTAGIVSATGRAIGQGPYDDFIQTDASINPGNSGGPLLNLEGEVVGINSAIFSQTGGNVGIGFAIPANLANGVIDALKTKGKVVRGWLGVVIQDVTEDLAQSFGLPEPKGALVADLSEKGPGAKGGIERGDVIVEFDGKPVKSSHELPSMVASTPIGKDASVKVLRAGKEKTLTVKIAEMPKEAGGRGGEATDGEDEEGPSASALGLLIGPITPEVASELGVPAGSGVVVRSVKNGSRAEDAGIRPGDVIQEVNRQPVKSIEDFKKALGAKKSGTQLLLVKRGTATIFLAVKPPAK